MNAVKRKKINLRTLTLVVFFSNPCDFTEWSWLGGGNYGSGGRGYGSGGRGEFGRGDG